jgi:hypothetical protein
MKHISIFFIDWFSRHELLPGAGVLVLSVALAQMAGL